MLAGTLASLLLAPALLLGGPAPAATPAATTATATNPVTWEIDTSHSELSFRIRHLVSRVRGSFNQWGGSIVADPQNLAGARVDVAIQTASIDTGNERRDEHLRGDDFFGAPTHPVITFRSTRVEPVGGDRYRVHGNLTMRGVTRPVVLDARMVQTGTSQGRRRIGFEATTTVNRMDYGVSWNRAAEGGGAVLSDEVQIDINLAAVEKAG